MQSTACCIERFLQFRSSQINALWQDNRAAQKAMDTPHRILLVLQRDEHRYRTTSLGDRDTRDCTGGHLIENLEAVCLELGSSDSLFGVRCLSVWSTQMTTYTGCPAGPRNVIPAVSPCARAAPSGDGH